MTPFEILVLIITIVSILLFSTKNIWAWFFAILGNVLWLIIGFHRDLMIIKITSIMYALFNLRGCVLWYRMLKHK